LLLCWKPNDVAEVMTLPKKKRKKGLVMRKLFLMLAVLLIASAAYAVEDVNVYCNVADTNVVTVSYIADVDANVPRAFGLDIQLSNDATISDVTVLSSDYWVYPGSYPGSDPVGDVNDSSDTLPGVDSNGMTIEMGSLHSPPEVDSPNAPAISGDLISFKVSKGCVVAISGNAARGKVVFYDATNEDDGREVAYGVCEVVDEQNCWMASLCSYQSLGDASCDGSVNLADLIRLKQAFGKNSSNWVSPECCADFDHSNAVNLGDLIRLKQNFGKTGGVGTLEQACP
jgi:hypothetical protein